MILITFLFAFDVLFTSTQNLFKNIGYNAVNIRCVLLMSCIGLDLLCVIISKSWFDCHFCVFVYDKLDTIISVYYQSALQHCHPLCEGNAEMLYVFLMYTVTIYFVTLNLLLKMVVCLMN